MIQGNCIYDVASSQRIYLNTSASNSGGKLNSPAISRPSITFWPWSRSNGRLTDAERSRALSRPSSNRYDFCIVRRGCKRTTHMVHLSLFFLDMYYCTSSYCPNGCNNFRAFFTTWTQISCVILPETRNFHDKRNFWREGGLCALHRDLSESWDPVCACLFSETNTQAT